MAITHAPTKKASRRELPRMPGAPGRACGDGGVEGDPELTQRTHRFEVWAPNWRPYLLLPVLGGI